MSEYGNMARELFAKTHDIEGVIALLEEERADNLRGCRLVADMHAAAVGEVRGPRRGVVEDVANLRIEYQHALKHLETAWGVIANARGWEPENEQTDWRKAAEQWRDQYHILLGINRFDDTQWGEVDSRTDGG